MGFSEKPQIDGGAFDSDNRKWVIAGIALRAPIKPIYTLPAAVTVDKPLPQDGDEAVVETDECCTTPTSEETRIPTTFTCPPAPRKPKPPSSKFSFRRGPTRQFINPPDLETVFIRRVEKAN